MKKIAWIDQLKGVGIIAVVTAHVYDGPLVASTIYFWHMPLFFLLSGYLFKPVSNKFNYLKDKAAHLLVPYLVFLILLGARGWILIAQTGTPAQLALLILKDLLGGRFLYLWLGVFWFVSCLFITQQIANVLFSRLSLFKLWVIMGCSLTLAYLNSALIHKGSIPWNADVVLFALPLFFLGWRFKAQHWAITARFDGAALVLTLIAMALIYFRVIRTLNLKYVSYGTPVVTLLFCFAAVYLVIRVSQRISEESIAGKILASAGQASMVIMFLHQAINFGLEEFVTSNLPTRLLLAILIPWVLYYVLLQYRFSRAMFLGSKQDLTELGARKSVTA